MSVSHELAEMHAWCTGTGCLEEGRVHGLVGQACAAGHVHVTWEHSVGLYHPLDRVFPMTPPEFPQLRVIVRAAPSPEPPARGALARGWATANHVVLPRLVLVYVLALVLFLRLGGWR